MCIGKTVPPNEHNARAIFWKLLA